jgi:hypothetical protein
MGSIIGAIHDDIEEYKELCARYNETVRLKPTAQGIGLPDCYGPHASLLKARLREDWAKAVADTDPYPKRKKAGTP